MQFRHIRWIALGLVVLAAAFVLWSTWFGPTLPRDAYRYRYKVQASVPVTIAQRDLKDLEARTSVKDPSAFELAFLSSQYFQLGRLLGEVTWFDKAEATAKRSLALLSNPNPARLTLAKLADNRHQFHEAIRLAKEAMKDRPSSDVLSVLVTSHLALGEVATAEMYAEQAVELKPTLPNLLLRALTLLQQGRDEEATYDFKRSVVVEDLDSPFESSRLRALWARHLISRGDYPTAAALLDESLRVWPQNALAVGIRGELELSRGNYSAAQEHFINAFTLSKETVYLMNYGKAKAIAGDSKTAKEYFDQSEKLLRKEVTESQFGHRLQLAELLLMRGEKGDIDEAVKFASAEVKNRPSSQTFFVLAKALHLAKRDEEAAVGIKEALKSGVRNSDYFFLASEIEGARGNHPRAEFYAKLAKQINPHFNAVAVSQSTN